MADADRNAVEAFDRFLDTLAIAASDPMPAPPHPDLAETARRFHALASASLPSAARDRTWRHLMAPTSAPAPTAQTAPTASGFDLGVANTTPAPRRK